MARNKWILCLVCLGGCLSGNYLTAQEIVTDYDGNEYHTIVIGEQVWLKENLACLHYADGREIPDVAAYDDNEANAEIYGRLYTWHAAMGGENIEGAQGICPEGWHIPSDAEWATLEDYLGGASVAGGKLKEAGSVHWRLPNTAADNSSGFSALPAGEYDGHYTPYSYQLLGEYAVFWTSTSISPVMARERFLAYNSGASAIYDWYKAMKYSIRAIRDADTSRRYDETPEAPELYILYPGSPNPFNPSTQIRFSIPDASPVRINIIDIGGKQVKTLLDKRLASGFHSCVWDGTDGCGKSVSSGVYLVVMLAEGGIQNQKLSFIQ